MNDHSKSKQTRHSQFSNISPTWKKMTFVWSSTWCHKQNHSVEAQNSNDWIAENKSSRLLQSGLMACATITHWTQQWVTPLNNSMPKKLLQFFLQISWIPFSHARYFLDVSWQGWTCSHSFGKLQSPLDESEIKSGEQVVIRKPLSCYHATRRCMHNSFFSCSMTHLSVMWQKLDFIVGKQKHFFFVSSASNHVGLLCFPIILRNLMIFENWQKDSSI